MKLKTEKKIIGWREWIALPDLGVKKIKVKVDTGARSSSLHADNIEIISLHGKEKVKFEIFPLQRSKKNKICSEATLIDVRKVRSSSGHVEFRPVIMTSINLMGEVWPIEVNLTHRDIMGFRMLLGRQAIRSRFLVNPGLSFYDVHRKSKLKKHKFKIK